MQSCLPLGRVLPDLVTAELGHIEYGFKKTVELVESGDEGKAEG